MLPYNVMHQKETEKKKRENENRHTLIKHENKVNKPKHQEIQH